MPNPLLAIEHLRVDFPEVVAVNDLTLTVGAGDVCGLIGPNGAGKTTTMRAISGLQECTRGSVKVGGHELASEPDELKRQLGFMPDFCPTYDQLTASEFLDHFARAYDVPNRAKRIDECLELTWHDREAKFALCEGIVARNETAARPRENPFARPESFAARRTCERPRPAWPD